MFENWDANSYSWRSRRKCPQNENRNNAFDKSSSSAWRSLFLLADLTSFRNLYRPSIGARIYKKLSAHQKNIPTHNHDKEIGLPVYTKHRKLWPLRSDATHTNGPTARLGKRILEWAEGEITGRMIQKITSAISCYGYHV